MPMEIQLQARRTRVFSDSWSHLDQWQPLTTVKVMPERVLKHAPLGGQVSQRDVRLPAGLSRRKRRQLAQAILDTVGGGSCRHEYDCCGCVTRHAHLVHRSRRRLVLRVRSSLNL